MYYLLYLHTLTRGLQEDGLALKGSFQLGKKPYLFLHIADHTGDILLPQDRMPTVDKVTCSVDVSSKSPHKPQTHALPRYTLYSSMTRLPE